MSTPPNRSPDPGPTGTGRDVQPSERAGGRKTGKTTAGCVPRVDWLTSVAPAQRNLDGILAEAAVAICIVEGPEHTFIFANPACLAILGDAAIIGKPLRSALPDIVAQGFGAVLDGVLQTGLPVVAHEVEVRLAHRAPDDTAYMNYTFQPKRDSNGHIDGVLVCASEVTQQVVARHRAEASIEALQLSDEQFRLAIRSSGLIVFGQDVQLRHLWIHNPIPGFTSEGIVGRTDAELHPPENVERLEILKRRALAGDVIREQVPLRVGEEIRYFQLTVQPHRDAAGVIDGLLGASLDVTDQVRVREHLEALAEKLGESEAQFRTLADSIPQLAWIAEADGNIHWYNRRWYDYTGTTLEEMEKSGWGRVHDPDELPRVVAGFQSALASGVDWEDTFSLRRADGVFQWFLSRAMPVRDSAGRIVRWFGTNTNIDEQRKNAATLKEAVALRDDFLSIASHELRTPLAALLMHIQGIQRARTANAPSLKIDERLEKAANAGKRLDNLINQMLDVSRITSGRLLLDPETLQLDELLRDIVERFSEQGERTGSPITLRATGAVRGAWDRLRIDQVFSNLVGNALKYGAGKPIDIELAPEGDGVSVRVIDRGIGIHPSQQQIIFGRFERAVGAREFGGFGLGLWICRQIVEASGGTISVESTPAEGSTFTVWLPIIRPAATPNGS